MSYALSKLRTMLNDPVLVKTSQGMIPTPRALQLVGPLRKALVDIHQTLSPPKEFEPQKAVGHLRVAITDHTAMVLLPELVQRLNEAAPQLNIEFSHWRGQPSWHEVESGIIDLAIGVGDLDDAPAGLFKRKLFSENKFLCAVRQHHPLVRKRLTLRKFLQLHHILVAPRGGSIGLVDYALASLGLKRRVSIIVPHFLVAPFLVARTDMVLTLSEKLLRPFGELLALDFYEPPVKIIGGQWYCMWHERTHREPLHKWFRGELLKLGDQIENGRTESWF